MYFDRELAALKRSNRFRKRRIVDENLLDFASNDYLGLAHRKKSCSKAYDLLCSYGRFAPKASMLVNGYHPLHRMLEEKLAELNGFEAAIVTGSGFLSNITLIESMVRKGDTLLIDEEFHASGILAASILGGRVSVFAHNDPKDLERRLESVSAKRVLIAIEGVYSMSGDLADRGIFDIADRYGALLLVDEAHSSGVIGSSLLGIFDHYGIEPRCNHIKMGTLGKAYGSYGSYILASKEIIRYLENRGKPVIYSTALSLFDTALALVNIEYISLHTAKLKERIEKRKKVLGNYLGNTGESMIIPIECGSDKEVMSISEKLMDRGFVVGAIRRPTVLRPILRVIPRLGCSSKQLRGLLESILEIKSALP